jgi:hypothetical protein
MADNNDDVTSGFGCTLEIETAQGSGVFFEAGLVYDVQPPGDTVDQFDKTHMKSPGGREENGSGIVRGGEGSYGINWVPGNDTDVFINAWLLARDVRKIRITYPNNVTETAPNTITGFSRAVPMNDKMSGTLTTKKAGDVEFGVAA